MNDVKTMDGAACLEEQMTEFAMVALFFGGGLPGMILALKNMREIHVRATKVEKIANKEGHAFPLNSDLKLKAKLMVNPESLVGEEDSLVLRQAKMDFIEFHRAANKRHYKFGLLMWVGALLGGLVGMYFFG